MLGCFRLLLWLDPAKAKEAFTAKIAAPRRYERAQCLLKQVSAMGTGRLVATAVGTDYETESPSKIHGY
jgi:hypothetical protein